MAAPVASSSCLVVPAGTAASAPTPQEPIVTSAGIDELMQNWQIQDAPINEAGSCAIAVRLLLKKKTFFRKTDLSCSLLQYLISDIRTKPTEVKELALVKFLEALRNGSAPANKLFSEHLQTHVSERPLALLGQMSAGFFHCNLESILRHGLKDAEPDLFALLEQTKLPFRAGQSLRDAIGEFTYYIVDDQNREKIESLGLFLIHFLSGRPFSVLSPGLLVPTQDRYQKYKTLVTLLSERRDLSFLPETIIPSIAKGEPRSFSPEGERDYLLFLISKCPWFSIKPFVLIGKEYKKIHAQLKSGPIPKSGAGGRSIPTINHQREVLSIKKQVLQSKIFAKMIHQSKKKLDKLQTTELSIVPYLAHCRLVDKAVKTIVETCDKLCFQQMNGEADLTHLRGEILRDLFDLVYVREFSLLTINALQRLQPHMPAPAASDLDKLLDFELEEEEGLPCEPQAEVEEEKAEPTAAAAASSSSQESPKSVKKISPIVAEDVTAMTTILETPTKLFDGGISSTIHANMDQFPIKDRQVGKHLLLAMQGFELFCDLYRTEQYHLLAPCLQSFLLDCHVAVERQLSLPKSTHSLLEGFKGGDGDPNAAFIQTHDRALLWTRYLAHFMHQNHPPAPALWLESLMKNPNKENAACVLENLIQSTKGLLQFMGVNNPLIDKVLATLPSLPTVKMEIPKQTSSLSARIDLLIQQIEAQGPKAALVLISPRGNVKEHLDEICNYLKWIKKSHEIKTLFPHPKWDFFLLRIQLNMDKLFKHLFATDALLLGYGEISSHHLTSYLEFLEGEVELSMSDHITLKAINVGISHHYMDLFQQSHAASLNPLFTDSMQALSLPPGFQLANRTSSTKALKSELKRALDLFEQLVPSTLARLQERVEAVPIPASLV